MTDFNEFMEKYDCFQDGVEDKIMEFFKSNHQEYYLGAKELRDEREGDSGEPSPSEMCDAFEKAGKEELFYEIVKNWFHATFPEDYK